MNIGKMLKDIKSLEKKDENLFFVLSEFLARSSEELFDSKIKFSISLTYNILSSSYFKYQSILDKKIKLSSEEYYEKRTMVKTNQGILGLKSFEMQFKKQYDPKAYEKDLKIASKIVNSLNKMGLKANFSYDKSYKKNTEPSDIYIQIKW